MMNSSKKNLILIGMPGSGKSTVGIVLAKLISYDFVDTDVLIQVSAQRSLQSIVDDDGYMALRKIEEGVLINFSSKKDCQGYVVSTGGSAVYSETGMEQLKAKGICILLDVELSTLESRIGDFSQRGIAKRADQSLAEVLAERKLLYTKFADVVIKCDDFNVDQVCEEIIKQVDISTL